MKTLYFSVEEAHAGQRIDRFLSKMVDEMSRSSLTKLIEDGAVQVDGSAVAKSFKLPLGGEVTLAIPDAKPLELVPEDIPLEIVYDDDDLSFVNKPKEMVVHPAAGNETGTLVHALLFHCKDSLSGINGIERPGIVHRIDKDTSGLLVVAKNDLSHRRLSEQIKAHSFTREYLAVVYGRLKDEDGTVNAPIGRHRTDRKKMCVTDRNSKEAITHYHLLEDLGEFSLIQCRLETGRTHQIRVHMAYIGHPVAGDEVYGPKKVITELHGQCLHAASLGFVHPSTGEYIQFHAEPDERFTAFLEKCRRKANR